MHITTIRKSFLYQLLCTIIVIILFIIIGYKLIATGNKIDSYNKAELLMSDNNLVDAFAYYTEANENRWIQYKEKETTEALTKLQPVADIQTSLQAMREAIASKSISNEILIKTYNEYRSYKNATLKKTGNVVNIFHVIDEQYGLEQSFSEKFIARITSIEKNISDLTSKKETNQELIITYFTMPSEYMGGEDTRLARIAEILIPYDTMRIELIAQDANYSNVQDQSVNIHTFYKDHNIKAYWIPELIEQVALARLTAMVDDNNIASFLNVAKKYESSNLLINSSNSVIPYIQKSHQSFIDKAAQMVKESNYADAIELYNQLDVYKDTSKQVKDVQIKWAKNDPNYLLEKAYAGQTFSEMINGTNQFNAVAYVVAANNNKLVLVTMNDELTVSQQEISLPAGFSVKTLRTENKLSPSGETVFLLEGSSSSRKNHYVAYQYSSNTFSNLLDLEADSYTIESAGKLLVNNATGEGSEQLSWYDFSNGNYYFTAIKPDYTEINLSELINYKNQKVRFHCEIITTDGSTAIVQYGDEYILLTDVANLYPGYAIITGTYTSTDVITNGDQQFTAYNVKVSEATQ